MGSHGRREPKQLVLEPKRNARFFQIITEEQAGEGRLSIPRKFAKKYGNDLLNEVFLEVPTGAVWKVELVKFDDRLWLQNGWREFQEYYSIGRGTFLIFEYTSRSYFHVVLCDTSASEIDYPFRANDGFKEPKFGVDRDEARIERNGGDNESTKILNSCLPSSKKRKELVSPCPRPPKMGRTSSTFKSEAKSGSENISSCKHGKDRISMDRKVLRNDEKTKAFHRARGTSEIQELTTLTSMKSLKTSTEAAGLKDENPSFSIVIKLSYVNHVSYTSIPIKFAENHFREKRGNVILQISHRKKWNVNFRIHGRKAKRAHLYRGWYTFVLDNNLEVGDVCVFELIDRTKLILKVVINRASNGKITREPKEKFLLPCRCPAGKTMKTAKLDSSLELRKSVAPINHQLGCIKSENSTGDEHLSDPKLQCENTCKQKCLSGRKHKVSGKNVEKKSLTAEEKAKALSKATRAFKSENPFIMVAMQPAYIESNLKLPFKFAKRHFTKEKGEIVLQVTDGRAWTVDYRMKSNQRRAAITCSWTTFVQDNSLAVGDVCIFELIESTKIVLKVTISRADDTLPSLGSMHDSRGNVKENNITVAKEIEFGCMPTIDKAVAACSPDGNSSGKIDVYEGKPGCGLPERSSCSWAPKVVEAAEKFTSAYPSFKVFMGISNLRGNVTVPAKFMKFLKQGTEKVLKLRLRVRENMWPVKLTRKCKIAKLTSGWKVFSGENNLQAGDCCIFELVDSKSLLLKVSIFRHNG